MEYDQIFIGDEWEKIILFLKKSNISEFEDITDDIIEELYFVPGIDYKLIDQLKLYIDSLSMSNSKYQIDTQQIAEPIYDDIEGSDESDINWYDNYPWQMLLGENYKLKNSFLKEIKEKSIFSVKDMINVIPIEKKDGNWNVSDQKITEFNDYILSKLSLVKKTASFLEIDRVVDGLNWENFYSYIDLNKLFDFLPESIFYANILDILDMFDIEVDSKRIVNRLENITFKDFVDRKDSRDFNSVRKDELYLLYSRFFETLRKEFLTSSNSNDAHKMIFKVSDLFVNISIEEILELLIEKERDNINKVLAKYNVKKMTDLMDMEFEKIDYIISKPLIDLVSSDYPSLFSKMISEFPDNMKQIIEGRVLGDTLQIISDGLNVTRERVRQIEKKILNSLMDISEQIAAILTLEKGFFSGNDISKIFRDEFTALTFIWVLNKRSEKYDYLYYVDLVVEKREFINDFKETINEKSDDIGSIEELFGKIESTFNKLNLNFINEDNLSVFLIELLGYRVMNGTYIKKGISDNDFIAHIIAEEFPDGIKLDSNENNQDIRDFRKYMERNYPKISLSDTNRSLTAKITRSNNLVLRDRGKYISILKVYISDELLNDIYNWIQKRNTTLTYNEVFQQFKSRLLWESSIDNFNFLHGVLKYYFSDRFNFSRDSFSILNSEKISIDQRVIRLVKRSGIISEAEIIMEIPGIKDYQIFRIVERNKELFRMGDKRINLLDNVKISDEELFYCQKLINDLLIQNNEYISSKYLYKILLDSNEKINLETLTDLGEKGFFQYLSKKLSQVYDFRYPHIVRSNGVFERNEIESATIIKKLFIEDSGMLSRRKLESFRKKFQWSELTTYSFLSEGRQNLIRVSEDEYVTLERSGLTDEMLSKIDLLLDDTVIDYYPVKDFYEFNKLPNSKFEWNHFFLEDIIYKFSEKFKIIDREKNGMHFISSVIVSQTSKFDIYEDIVIFELKKTGKLRFSEREMRDVLASKGLIINNIPLELRKGDRIEFNERSETFVLK